MKAFSKLLVFFFSIITINTAFGQCDVGNTVGTNDPENDFFWGQSFTAECDGTLNYVEWTTGNGGGQQLATTLDIFAGETVSGTPAYSQEIPAQSFSGPGESYRIELDTEFPVVVGQKYTFEAQIFVNMQISTANPYSGGIAFENGTGFGVVDFVFSASIDDVLAVTDTTLSSQISYAPNPVTNDINIVLSETYSNLTITVSNISGQVIYSGDFDTQDNIAIDTSYFANGVYIATVSNSTETTTFKFVKA